MVYMGKNSSKKLNASIIINILAFITFIIFFTVFYIFDNEINNFGLVLLLFILIGIFCLYSMIKELLWHSYSLVLMEWAFCFLFYFSAGFVQSANGSFLHGWNIPYKDVVFVCLYILFWMVMFNIASDIIKYSKIKKNAFLKNILETPLKINGKFVSVATFLSMIITIYLIVHVGFIPLLSRGSAEAALSTDSIATTLLSTYMLRNTVLYGFAISLAYFKKNRKGFARIAIQLLCVLIVCSPFGMPRFNAAAVYIGIFLLVSDNIKKSRSFIFLFFIIFLIVFPMLDSFRFLSINEINLNMLTRSASNIKEYFKSANYDAFSMIHYTREYVTYFGTTHGYQLLGALLFFIPRGIWVNKPIGSGATVAQTFGFPHPNVSSPLIAEGIMNFGLLGVGVFAFLIGMFVKVVDEVYWNQNCKDSNYRFIDIAYPFIIPLFFFINRGDMLSTYSFMVSHIAVLTMMFGINNILVSRNKA